MESETSSFDAPSDEAAPRAGAKESKNWSRMAFMGTAFIVGLILLIGLTYLTTSSELAGDKQANEDESSGGGGAVSSDGSSPTYIDTKKKTPSTAATTTRTTTRKTTTTKKTTPGTTTTPARMVRLTCTFGVSGADIAMVPPDGLCDYIFYTDVYYNVQRHRIIPTHGMEAFEALKEAAKTYNITTMGTSMALGAIGNVVEKEESKLLKTMHILFNDNFVHFGILNIDRIDEDFEHLQRTDFRYLDTITHYLRSKHPPSKYHCAIGMGVTKKDYAPGLVDQALEAIKMYPRISMVIWKIHIGRGFYPGDNYAAPPNPDYDDFHGLNFISLNVTAPLLPGLASVTAAGGRLLMLSLAMYARVSRMKDDYDQKTITPAHKNTLIDYAAACNCSAAGKCVYKTYPRDKKLNSTTLQVWADRTVVMYETTAQMKEKARHRMDLLVPKHTFGLAVYHVEMDDPDGACGMVFERLHAIKDTVSQYQTP